MTINIENEAEYDFGFDYEKYINDVINEAVDFAKCPYEAEVNVLITDNASIHEINKEQRNIDRPTDVLSFPMVEYEEPGNFDFLEEDDTWFNPDTGELLLGDIVLSYEKIVEQAKEYGHSQIRELSFLVAHSMLHLFGYDHEEDNERIAMENMQNKILENLGIGRLV